LEGNRMEPFSTCFAQKERFTILIQKTFEEMTLEYFA
jgi:hypothetical protein